MDNRELYEGFKSMEDQIQLMLNKFSELRNGTTHVLERDSELKIENQHLRGLLKQQQHDQTKSDAAQISHDKSNKSVKTEPQLPKSRKNLLKLYNEGFHICNQFFGKHRDERDNCLFCNEILFRNHGK